MTNEKRDRYREISKFLTSVVTKKGFEKFNNFKFSFKNLIIVERDNRIKEAKGKRVTNLAGDVKLSRNQVYRVLRRK